MENKRYDVVCKEARKRIKGIECILDMVDEEGGHSFHDSVIEHIDFNADEQTLIVDIGDVWAADQIPAGRFRFIFRGYMEWQLDYTSGTSFTFDFCICSEHRSDLLKVEFNSLHLEVICRDIAIEENPYTEDELKKFK